MRTAICLYGQPRNFTPNWEALNQNVVIPNNADVFFHTWYDPTDTRIKKMTPGHENLLFELGLDTRIPSETKAKKYLVEKQIPFHGKKFQVTDENIQACWPWSGVYDKELFLENLIRNFYSMWYSVNQSILLKELYAQENGFEYDCVILSRFDTSPKKNISVDQFDLSCLNSSHLNFPGGIPRGEINDWFLFSNNSNMNIISSIFYTMDYHIKKISESNSPIFTNESFIRDQTRLFGINSHTEDLSITF